MAVWWDTRPRFWNPEAMNTNTPAEDKRNAVEHLSFGAKTEKRVTWEAWEFAVEAPHLIRVTNASYGFKKADHSYLVGVEDCDGVLVPAECECPADMYRDDYDCKHKLALAVVGGAVVLGAAVDYPTDSNASSGETQARTDGGVTTEETGEESHPLDAEEREECDCAELSNGFPCWPCVRDGKRELPE